MPAIAKHEEGPHEDTTCIFCNIPKSRIFIENEHCYGIRDAYPVTPLHTLIIPRRHAIDWFELTQTELLACDDLLRHARREILRDDAGVTGFNIGANCGETAGQTVFHCHLHLIPRRSGDVGNPRGGVRHTVPGKGYY